MRSVIKYLTWAGQEKLKRAAFLAGVVVSFHGCDVSREAICREFPGVTEEIGGLKTEISTLDTRVGPRRPAKGGRKIASLPASPAPDAEEILDQREAWMKWGENALKRTQWARDGLEDDKRGRKALPALSDAGISLVSFHGFLEQEKWSKASAELDRVEASLIRARKAACDGENPGDTRKTRKPASKTPKAKKQRK